MLRSIQVTFVRQRYDSLKTAKFVPNIYALIQTKASWLLSSPEAEFPSLLSIINIDVADTVSAADCRSSRCFTVRNRRTVIAMLVLYLAKGLPLPRAATETTTCTNLDEETNQVESDCNPHEC